MREQEGLQGGSLVLVATPIGNLGDLSPRAHAALAGADLFIGTSRRGSVDPSLMAHMAPRPMVFALANPEPEVFADELRADAITATGRSDMPNQINNSLCFPGFFKGALAARAAYVTTAMKQAATQALAGSVSDDELAVGVIVPSMFQPRVHERVAAAVQQAWTAEHQASAEGDASRLVNATRLRNVREEIVKKYAWS